MYVSDVMEQSRVHWALYFVLLQHVILSAWMDLGQPVREAVYGLFTAGWFGVREKHCSWLEIYDRLRASEQADYTQGQS